MVSSLLGARRAGKAEKKQSSFRPDIQGLRAFAVLAVILDHLLHWPKGGFVGVDVFFVLSGFLITGHLLREYSKTGTISFVSFYRKRTKRIMPAAALVLVVTLAASFAVFNEARFKETLWDGLWGLLFGANWRFAAVGTDYFQADGPVSPLQHFWSLAVEEQFYFVWPWLLLLVFALFMRRSRPGSAKRAYVIAGASIGVVSLASLAWAIHETSSSAGLAYFSTFSRGWELGVGAALACAVPLLNRLGANIRPLLAWVGVVGLVVSLFVIDEAVGFPAPAALLPVLSTALVVAAGTGAPAHPSLAVLTNPVSSYLGDISYSLYLWHFPVIIIGAAIFPEPGVFYFLGVAAATLFCAILAYNLCEDPIRKSQWLEPKSRRKGRSRPPLVISDRFKYSALTALAGVTVATLAVSLVPTEVTPSPVPVSVLATTGTQAPSAPQYGPEVTALQKELKLALQAPEWPSLSPSLDKAVGSPQARGDIENCGKPDGYNPATCVVGSPTAKKTAVLLGSSIAMTYAGPLIETLGDGWRVTVLGAYGCPFSSVFIPSSAASLSAACKAKNDEGVRIVRETAPDVVFIANAYSSNKPEGATTALSPADWESSIETAVRSWGSAADRVVFLTPPPADKDLGTCYTKTSTPSNCVSTVQSIWFDTFDAEKTMAKRLEASVVDTKALFCLDNYCPAFAGSTTMKSDRSHITVDYGAKIVPALRELLTEAKVL